MANSSGQSIVVALGVFDGVHRGHRDVLAQAAVIAKQRGAKCVVATFDPHPIDVLYPEAFLGLLMPLERRIALLKEAGADSVEVLHFDIAFSHITAPSFVQNILVEQLGADVVVVGANFRFGHKAAGDVQLLKDFGQTLGLEVQVCTLQGDDHVWSSTRIRQALGAGNIALANHILGRPHRISGPVVHGNHRGRDLGFPTANMAIDDGLVIPADGIYAGLLHCHSGTFPVAISIGTNPTFDDVDGRRVEAYVIGRNDLDLYDQVVDLDFIAWVRATQAFTHVSELTAAMSSDVEKCTVLVQEYLTHE